MRTTSSRPLRAVIGLALAAALLTGCSSLVGGQAIKIGSALGNTSTPPQQDGPNGPRKDVATADLEVTGDADTGSDKLAKNTIDDLYTYYKDLFPKVFGKEFTPAKSLVSYDSREPDAKMCGVTRYKVVNASYAQSCDTIAWDRGVLLPNQEKKLGPIAVATILAHEMGHLVGARLDLPNTKETVLLGEQQADCYAGAYWRWVADGNSKYYDFSQGAGMREALTGMMAIADPPGLSPTTDGAHGNGFDRTFAFSLGYTNGAQRCNKIDMAEVKDRITESGFTALPKDYGNVPVDEKTIGMVTATLDSFFSQRFPGYRKPELKAFDGTTGPDCGGAPTSFPVGYCPASNTISYNLKELQRIATPTDGFKSQNGDFTAMLLLASRYGLAAQATTGAGSSGDQAGLRALCYAGTWASWMRKPQGGLSLSPNDLNKAVYAVMASPLPAADASGATSTRVIDQVQALYLGVIYQETTRCYDFYAG